MVHTFLVDFGLVTVHLHYFPVAMVLDHYTPLPHTYYLCTFWYTIYTHATWFWFYLFTDLRWFTTLRLPGSIPSDVICLPTPPRSVTFTLRRRIYLPRFNALRFWCRLPTLRFCYGSLLVCNTAVLVPGYGFYTVFG